MVIFRNTHKYSSYVPSRHMLGCTSLLLKKLCVARWLSGPLNWTEATSLQGRDARDTYRVQLPLPQLQQHSVPRISVPAWESAEQNPRQSTLERPLESEVALLPQCTVPSTLRATCHCSITLPSWHTVRCWSREEQREQAQRAPRHLVYSRGGTVKPRE